MRAKRARGEWGFTLIELLVVIVILGIIASVVVLAVGGIDDKGEEASFQTDVQTLRTAQEAHCAKGNPPGYAEEAQLVERGFLASESTLNNTRAIEGDGCADQEFLISCAPSQAGCGQNGTTPDGDFDNEDGGSWDRTGDLSTGAFVGPSQMVTMPSGKVLFFAQPTFRAPTATSVPRFMVYDPSSGEWENADPPPPWGPSFSRAQPASGTYQTMLVLEGSPAECGALCGKVFVLFRNTGFAPEYRNVRAYIFDPAAHDAGSDPWTSVDPPHVQGDPDTLVLGGSTNHSPVQFDCDRTANPGSDCGKVLLPSSPDAWGENGARTWTAPPLASHRTALFDPVSETWALAPTPIPDPPAPSEPDPNPTPFFASATILGDGKALVTSHPDTAQVYDPVAKTWTATDNTPGDLGCQTNGGDGILLPGGSRVLYLENLCGGSDTTGLIFDAGTGLFSSTVPACPCLPGISDRPPWMFLLPPAYGGKVLIVTSGNTPADGNQKASALYDPATNTWEEIVPAFDPRFIDRFGVVKKGTNYPAATMLQSGRVLLAGGSRQTSLINGTAMTDSWLYTAPLAGG